MHVRHDEARAHLYTNDPSTFVSVHWQSICYLFFWLFFLFFYLNKRNRRRRRWYRRRKNGKKWVYPLPDPIIVHSKNKEEQGTQQKTKVFFSITTAIKWFQKESDSARWHAGKYTKKILNQFSNSCYFWTKTEELWLLWEKENGSTIVTRILNY